MVRNLPCPFNVFNAVPGNRNEARRCSAHRSKKMIYHVLSLGVLVVLVAVVAIRNDPRLNRLSVMILVALLALRELAIPIYGRILIQQAPKATEVSSPVYQGASDAMHSYAFLSFHLIPIYIFIVAVSWRAFRPSRKNPGV